MTELRRQERVRVEALERRRDRIAERLREPNFRGDPNRQRGEIAALNWALRLVDACAREGLLSDLRHLGHDV